MIELTFRGGLMRLCESVGDCAHVLLRYVNMNVQLPTLLSGVRLRIFVSLHVFDV